MTIKFVLDNQTNVTRVEIYTVLYTYKALLYVLQYSHLNFRKFTHTIHVCTYIITKYSNGTWLKPTNNYYYTIINSKHVHWVHPVFFPLHISMYSFPVQFSKNLYTDLNISSKYMTQYYITNISLSLNLTTRYHTLWATENICSIHRNIGKSLKYQLNTKN